MRMQNENTVVEEMKLVTNDADVRTTRAVSKRIRWRLILESVQKAIMYFN